MHTTYPSAVHIFHRRGHEVRLLRRLDTGYEHGKLSVVAGHVEAGETVTQAALRETPPADTIPYVRAALENFTRGVWFQQFGWTPRGH